MEVIRVNYGWVTFGPMTHYHDTGDIKVGDRDVLLDPMGRQITMHNSWLHLIVEIPTFPYLVAYSTQSLEWDEEEHGIYD